MKNFLFALWGASLDIAVCFWVDVQNLFRHFRKKKITSFDETDVYDNPKLIDNGRKNNAKIPTTRGGNFTRRVDERV